ncbi:MAG: ATPase [candidate division Zixibacteria bacterium]|nr:ATPase [candidate division Zixibacteria bacterium]
MEKQNNNTKKIAIPISEGKMCLHFGHCENFALMEVDTEAKTIINKTELTPPPHEPGVLPRWLSEQGTDIIIAGGMGMRAQQFFKQYNIDVMVGAPPDTPENLVLNYMNDTLHLGDNVCDH